MFFFYFICGKNRILTFMYDFLSDDDALKAEKKGFVVDDVTFHLEEGTDSVKGDSSKKTKTANHNISLQDFNDYNTEGSSTSNRYIQSSSESNEVYMTPSEEINTNPITPPYCNQPLSKKSLPSPPHLHIPPTIIGDNNDVIVQNNENSKIVTKDDDNDEHDSENEHD